ncbi:MAG: pitrilysin family protein [Gemmatimonadota bacterium]|nr:pitrilysin family protein [Gemmatimonadota bacterium]
MIADALLGEGVYRSRLGGLDVWAVPRPGSRQKAAVLYIDYGSVDLHLRSRSGQVQTTPAGTAHFLEHRLFAKFYGDITEQISRLGGDVNASTSFTSTIFSLTCIEHFADHLALLFELALDLHVLPDGVAQEREIIDHELQISCDDPEWIGFLRGLEGLYQNGLLAWDMAGTRESIGQIDQDTLTRCHEVFYRPEYMGLYLCGDFDVETTYAAVESTLLKYSRSRSTWDRVERPVVLPTPHPLRALALPVSRPYTLLFFGDDKAGRSGRDLLLRELALELALDIALGPASDFFAAHYEDGLIDGEAFGAEVYAEPTFCFCTVGGYTQQSERLCEEIGAALAGLDERVVTADLGRAKRKVYGLLLRAWEQAEDVADMLCSAAASGADPSVYFDVHEQIGAGDILEVLESCLSPAHQSAMQIVPSGRAE